MKKVIENTAGQKLDDYLQLNIYQPLGLKKTMFNPLGKVPIEDIVPSEKDDYWRSQLIQGTVHDMGAAMLGGVGGHAGLFSNTKEIATTMQMLLNKGMYGGYRFFDESTVDLFTTRYYKSTRRGLGFDLKEKNDLNTMNMGNLASDSTFGHTGFTGTCAYADPENNLIYVFLSNRTYPTMNNNLLNKNDYRSKIQNLIYKAMKGNK
jgi:beta-N-acetylhexosaminidase